jgi:hypothetical protein
VCPSAKDNEENKVSIIVVSIIFMFASFYLSKIIF